MFFLYFPWISGRFPHRSTWRHLRECPPCWTTIVVAATTETSGPRRLGCEVGADESKNSMVYGRYIYCLWWIYLLLIWFIAIVNMGIYIYMYLYIYCYYSFWQFWIANCEITRGKLTIWLVVWNLFVFHSVGKFIIPTHALLFFRGVAQSPTSYDLW